MEKVLEKKLEETNFKESNKNSRNIGIDLLRIISMFMVVVLHILGHGAIIKNCAPLSLNHDLSWLLEIVCYGAVNLFALTTGYVYVNAKFKYSKILSLWLQVFFYSARNNYTF